MDGLSPIADNPNRPPGDIKSLLWHGKLLREYDARRARIAVAVAIETARFIREW
jgi:hypothetical protein